MRILLIIPVVLLTLLSCGKEGEYAPCSMPKDMKNECELSTDRAKTSGNEQWLKDQCEGSGLECQISCVVGSHPECDNNPCVQYNYKNLETGTQFTSTSPFCSKECTPDKDGKSPVCGDDALCMPILDKNYCIPLEYMTPGK